MNVQDIAALIALRNYVFTVREDRNIFKKETYREVSAKIQEIDKFLAASIIDFDLDSIVNPETAKSKEVNAAKTTNGTAGEIVTGVTLESDESILMKNPEQGSLDFSENKEVKDKITKPSKGEAENLSSDDDDALVARRVAEEKSKIANRKKAK